LHIANNKVNCTFMGILWSDGKQCEILRFFTEEKNPIINIDLNRK